MGVDDTGGPPSSGSGFPWPTDDYGLNESNPPQDGQGHYIFWAALGNPAEATPEGALICTFLFEALAATLSTPVDIVEVVNNHRTRVIDGTVPGLIVTGDLSGATVTIVYCPDCPGDFDYDNVVDLTDFTFFAQYYGSINGDPNYNICADFDEDDVIDLTDFTFFAQRYGELCP
jgi:hypothetical protein